MSVGSGAPLISGLAGLISSKLQWEFIWAFTSLVESCPNTADEMSPWMHHSIYFHTLDYIDDIFILWFHCWYGQELIKILHSYFSGMCML